MAIAVTLRGFNILGCLVTPIFLSVVHFLYQFSTFCEKVKKIYGVKVLKNAPSNSIYFTSSFSSAAVLNASLMVKICKSGGNI